MRLKNFLTIPLMVIMLWSTAYGWDTQTLAPGVTSYSAQNPASVSGQTGSGALPGSSVPAWSQSNLPSQAQQNLHRVDDGETPYYPYPRYHNPYYDESSEGNMLSGIVDRILRFPSNAVQGFSNFMGSKFFPAVPAAHGGSQPARENANVPERDPLPGQVPSGPASVNPRR